MPVIFIYGLPFNKKSATKFDDFKQRLFERIAEIKTLGITKNDISLFTPCDIFLPGNEIVAIADLLFKKPERTKEVIQLLAETILEQIDAFMRECALSIPLIEVAVREFDQSQNGFASRKI